MAYYLQTFGNSESISLPSFTSRPTGGVEWELSIAIDSVAYTVLYGCYGIATSVLMKGTGALSITVGNRTLSDIFADRSDIVNIRFGYDGTDIYAIVIDGLGVIHNRSTVATPDWTERVSLSQSLSFSTALVRLYYFSFSGATANPFYYEPSATPDPSLPILFDTVGGNHGTLQNFTLPDAYVYYDDSAGGVTVDAAFTVSAPTVSASATATIAQPIANVSYAVSTPSVSATTTATLPTPVADIAFTLSIPSVTANASVTLPNPNADISFTVNSASVSGVASATLPNPSASVSYTVSAPSVSANVSATLPSYNASIAFAVNSPGVYASVGATLPQPAANVDFAVSAPQISVVAIVGGIEIIVDDETNINQRVLSNNINQLALSNNINAPALSNNING